MTGEQERRFFESAWKHVKFRGKRQYRFDAGSNLTLLIDPAPGPGANCPMKGQVLTGPNRKAVIKLMAAETETLSGFALRLIKRAEDYLSEQRQFHAVMASDLESTLQRHGVKPGFAKTY